MSFILENIKFAITKDNLKLLKELLEHPEVKNLDSLSLIIEACKNNNKEAVKVLFDKMNFVYNRDKFSFALKFAIKFDNVDLIKILRVNNTNTHYFSTDRDFMYIIDFAIETNSAKVIEEFLKHLRTPFTKFELFDKDLSKMTPEVLDVFEKYFETFEGQESEPKKIKK